jgi:hypothetical protein
VRLAQWDVHDQQGEHVAALAAVRHATPATAASRPRASERIIRRV